MAELLGFMAERIEEPAGLVGSSSEGVSSIALRIRPSTFRLGSSSEKNYRTGKAVKVRCALNYHLPVSIVSSLTKKSKSSFAN